MVQFFCFRLFYYRFRPCLHLGAVPVKNNSSAIYNSSLEISRISQWISCSFAKVNMLSLVIPFSAPDYTGGVIKELSFTRNMFSALASTTIPSELSIIASSKPAFNASTLARAELA